MPSGTASSTAVIRAKPRASIRTRVWLDIALFVGYVALSAPRTTGIPFHEYFTVVFIPIFIAHLRPVAPGLIRNASHVGLATALVGLVPAGLFPTLMLRRFAASHEWPSQLWVSSVRIDDGHTVVFGPDVIPATLGDALEATFATRRSPGGGQSTSVIVVR